MRDAFSAFYRPSDEQMKAAWKDATVVLDTNMLLNLYRFPLAARNELLAIFKKLQGQLWIPFHVGLEFQRNRLRVIAGQQRRFSEVKGALDQGFQTMSQKLSSLQLSNRHSTIDPQPFLAEIEGAVSLFKAKLDELKGSDEVTLDADTIRDQLDEILAGRIGDAPSGADIEQIQKEGDIRFKYQLPPGYEDVSKDKQQADMYMYQGIHYSAKYGDLIVWKQLIAHARAKGLKKVIFLTDDEKVDWWESVQVDGIKKIGPRVELREELRREAGVEFFQIYNSESFLRYAKEHLGSAVKQESIDGIAQVLRHYRSGVESRPLARPVSDASQVAKAVRFWLQRVSKSPIYELPNEVASLWLMGMPVDLEVYSVPKDHLAEALLNQIDSRWGKKTSPPKLAIIVGSEGDNTSAARWFELAKLWGIEEGQNFIYGNLSFNEDDDVALNSIIKFKPLFGLGDAAIELGVPEPA